VSYQNFKEIIIENVNIGEALGIYYRSFEAGDTFLIFLPIYKTKPIRWANGF
jgi:hypothetical protein